MDDRRIESEQDPIDGGFRVDIESTGHEGLNPCKFHVPSRRDLFKRQTKDEDGLTSHLPPIVCLFV